MSLSLLAHAECHRGKAPGESRRTLASTGKAERPQGQLQPVGTSAAGHGWTRLTLLWLLIHLDEGTYAAYPTVSQMLIEFCQTAACKEQGRVSIGY